MDTTEVLYKENLKLKKELDDYAGTLIKMDLEMNRQKELNSHLLNEVDKLTTEIQKYKK